MNGARGMRRFAGAAITLLGLFVAVPATAHLKIVQGRLIDLVQRSDAIVIGTVSDSRAAGPRWADVTVKIDRVLAGRSNTPTAVVRSPTGLAPASRYVLFLRRVGLNWESLAPSGTVFATQAHDDAAYQQAVAALRRALRRPPAARIAALRAALVPALSASAPPLRYHAALELRALTHAGHPLQSRERQRLERILADTRTDPALRPLLAGLLRPPAH